MRAERTCFLTVAVLGEWQYFRCAKQLFCAVKGTRLWENSLIWLGTGNAHELTYCAMPPPGRPKNAELRTREYLLPDEVKALVAHAGTLGRHRTRDRTIILTMYRHGLRVSELIELKWEQVDFKQAEMHIRRLKGGTPAVHPVKGDELRLLRKLKREYDSKFVFISERGLPLSRSAVAAIVKRASEYAEVGLAVHPHML